MKYDYWFRIKPNIKYKFLLTITLNRIIYNMGDGDIHIIFTNSSNSNNNEKHIKHSQIIQQIKCHL